MGLEIKRVSIPPLADPALLASVKDDSIGKLVENWQKEQVLQRALEINQYAMKVIKYVAAALAGAALVGVWALPLDFVVRENGVKVLAIPATLVILPVAWLVCWIVHLVFDSKGDKALHNYHQFLVKELLAQKDPSEELKTRYALIAKEVKKFVVPAGVTEAAAEQFKFAVEAAPKMRTLDLGELAVAPEVVREVTKDRSLRAISWNCAGLTLEGLKVFQEAGLEVAQGAQGFKIAPPEPVYSRSDDSDSGSDYVYSGSSYSDVGVSASVGVDSGSSYSYSFEWR